MIFCTIEITIKVLQIFENLSLKHVDFFGFCAKSFICTYSKFYNCNYYIYLNSFLFKMIKQIFLYFNAIKYLISNSIFSISLRIKKQIIDPYNNPKSSFDKISLILFNYQYFQLSLQINYFQRDQQNPFIYFSKQQHFFQFPWFSISLQHLSIYKKKKKNQTKLLIHLYNNQTTLSKTSKFLSAICLQIKKKRGKKKE